MPTEFRLTTVDNPYSPFDEYDQWYTWDVTHGYNSSGLLARIVNTSFELSEKDQEVAIDAAIDEIVHYNVSGVHKKVSRQTAWSSRS